MLPKFIQEYSIGDNGLWLRINSIAVYDYLDPESVSLIPFIKSLKNKDDKSAYEKIRKNDVFNLYFKKLVFIIGETRKKYYKTPVLIFPPTKPGYDNQMKEIIFNIYKG